MKFVLTTYLDAFQKQQVLNIWNNEYPVQLRYTTEEFDVYLSKLTTKHHILLLDKEEIKGWFCSFDRENQRWFLMILDSDIQGKGFGTKLLNLAKEKESTLNGWVIDHDNDVKYDGRVYVSPISFYLKNDFEIHSEIRIETDKISAVKINWCKV